jgi:hypothetical protein
MYKISQFDALHSSKIGRTRFENRNAKKKFLSNVMHSKVENNILNSSNLIHKRTWVTQNC